MNFLSFSRSAAVGIGVFSVLAALGGIIIGLPIGHGGYIAISCLMAGIALSCAIWWRESKNTGHSNTKQMIVASFALASGLALYANLVWALWALGVPVDIGTVRDGRMAAHYWFGPFTLVYAVICYVVLHRPEETKSRE